jgi:adenylylsulfate reductase subunit B
VSVTFEPGLCVSCGACAAVCPGQLITVSEGVPASAERPEDCWGCASCLKACPSRAVGLWLPPALGGRGGRLTCLAEGGRLMWRLERPNLGPVDFPGEPEGEGGY